ncbi:mevalonate kinase [Fructobacillus evanidus]|uniref:Mevalonate kinase (ERG12) n=1 Tax=Fructobacillus evanidus TaxID=3064281 RepID=A0ABM9MLL5_9LACO|nr:Mevalonate kinase (ERG12) [Fructobacillus sp. LMG 32999]CAK1222431.1 Mevalonate kinase (ERG12) [Fructobacillus sp. LMG 32999]CAK1224502.1 Mevalonate kinase (ERG12) [Fructobacillus sp. LMG 32999]CAK1224683.1 Mevalonate kinase (ERG12) [Fructobacillus sp. LMG 32999]CAK1224858.1 Mevalonate kinase (ERG12) [Fructobacillus sp. LMG 32999]
MEKNHAGFGHSHAKAILIGDHAVVYQQPAVAIPLLNLKVTASVQAIASGQTIILGDQAFDLANLGADLEGLRQLIIALLENLVEPNQSFLLEVQSLIPQERGFGASAALATAITRAFFDWTGQDLGQDQLNFYTNLAESISHGSPSGIDAATVSAVEPVWFHQQRIDTFQTNLEATLVLADTGVRGQTVRAVNIVKDQLKKNYEPTWGAINHLGQLAFLVKEALANNDPKTLGQLFTDAHKDLQILQVSHPKLDTLVNAALAAGALGAKLTGSGIGGAMFALAQNNNQAQKIATALKQAGAKETWIQPLSAAN